MLVHHDMMHHKVVTLIGCSMLLGSQCKKYGMPATEEVRTTRLTVSLLLITALSTFLVPFNAGSTCTHLRLAGEPTED